MSRYQHVIQEFSRIETIVLGVQKEIKTLKNRVRAYKGWTKRYRRQREELKQANLVISQERDAAIQQLQIRQEQLLEQIQKAVEATKSRDAALLQLDDVINRIERYREICDRYNQMTFARKADLIKEAERLFFEDPVIETNVNFDPKDKPQMFTDRASIVRDLLDR